jgi:hypothetical protein
MLQRIALAIGYFFLCTFGTFASDISVLPTGINSSILDLTGAGIGIGQVEVGRPGRSSLLAEEDYGHEDVIPTEVFRQNGSPNIDDALLHPLQVAGVMISKDYGQLAGVAPDAKLYSSAYVAAGAGGEDILKTIQHVATRNGGDVRAINHSYGETFAGGSDPLDGSSYFTMGLDWSASAHNVLHVVAGNEFHQRPLPTDN